MFSFPQYWGLATGGLAAVEAVGSDAVSDPGAGMWQLNPKPGARHSTVLNYWSLTVLHVQIDPLWQSVINCTANSL